MRCIAWDRDRRRSHWEVRLARGRVVSAGDSKAGNLVILARERGVVGSRLAIALGLGGSGIGN